MITVLSHETQLQKQSMRHGTDSTSGRGAEDIGGVTDRVSQGSVPGLAPFGRSALSVHCTDATLHRLTMRGESNAEFSEAP